MSTKIYATASLREAFPDGGMGIIRSSFPFLLGTVCGVYIAQNYNVPNIHKIADYAVLKAKEMEQRYRKPKKPGDDI
ncbi:hypothetical protein L1887_23188 [Cichorium endivia]|nr:hypothetical protein L1887_23188 [Cichorium endivia]